jgi:hypothetical protein
MTDGEIGCGGAVRSFAAVTEPDLEERGFLATSRPWQAGSEDAVGKQRHPSECNRQPELVSSEHHPCEANRHKEDSKAVKHCMSLAR